jgi:hypothetical protein
MNLVRHVGYYQLGVREIWTCACPCAERICFDLSNSHLNSTQDLMYSGFIAWQIVDIFKYCMKDLRTFSWDNKIEPIGKWYLLYYTFECHLKSWQLKTLGSSCLNPLNLCFFWHCLVNFNLLVKAVANGFLQSHFSCKTPIHRELEEIFPKFFHNQTPERSIARKRSAWGPSMFSNWTK